MTQPLLKTRTSSHHWNTPHIGMIADGKYMFKQAAANFESCYKLKAKLYILIGILFLYMFMFELFYCKLQGLQIDRLEINPDDEVSFWKIRS